MIAISYAVWLILNEKVTLECLIVGIPVAAAAYWFAKACLSWNMAKEKCFYRVVPEILKYLVLLVKEVFKACVSVARFTLEGKDPEGIIVHFDSGLKSDFANAILANSITLTPGTITIEEDGSMFEVCGLTPEYTSDLDKLPFIEPLRKMENLVFEITGKENK